MMDSNTEPSPQVPHYETLGLYFSEANDSCQATQHVDFAVELLDEVEQATDFLQNAGLVDLSNLHHQGMEISETIVAESVRQKRLTDRQAETIRSRVRTLNKTLGNRQPRRKQRQDVRDVAWNVDEYVETFVISLDKLQKVLQEKNMKYAQLRSASHLSPGRYEEKASSTGSRSRSATPDSLDSTGGRINEESTSDEDQHQPTLPSLILPGSVSVPKGKLKYTSSEPVPSKQVFSRHDRGDVAHLGSENVILKGYHPLKEFGTIGRLPSLQNVRLSNNNNNNHRKHDTYFAELDNLIASNKNRRVVCDNSMAAGKDELLSFTHFVKTVDSAHGIESDNRLGSPCIHIDTLTDFEYQYLKPLLWVEVAAIFDSHKISVQKRKASYKHKRGNVFGVNLSTLVMRDMPSGADTAMVPQIFQFTLIQLNKRIKEDGILRLAGQKQKLDGICEQIEHKFYTQRSNVEHLLEQVTTHDLTGVLKKLLRELPDPIFTMELFDMFFKINLIQNQDERIRALNILVLLLPVEHRSTFRLLLEFLINIVSNEQYNRMSVHNVAMIAAPSFFPPRLLGCKQKDDKQPITKEQLTKEINDAAVCCNIMESLLKTGDQLWMIPMELVEQAHEAQQRALDRKEKKIHSKKKLHRSSTQYEPGAMLNPKIKREYFL